MSDKPADEAERLRRFRQDKCYRLLRALAHELGIL